MRASITIVNIDSKLGYHIQKIFLFLWHELYVLLFGGVAFGISSTLGFNLSKPTSMVISVTLTITLTTVLIYGIWWKSWFILPPEGKTREEAVHDLPSF